MATDKLKTMNGAIIPEEITVVSEGSSSTYYKEFTKAVSKSGYTAVGLVGYRYNQVGIFCYRCIISGGTISLGLANRSGSGTMSSVTAYATVLWVRNDLV